MDRVVVDPTYSGDPMVWRRLQDGMMLKKNKTSAVILSGVAVFSMLTTFLFLERLFVNQVEASVLGDPGSSSWLTAVIGIVLLSLLLILPGAFFIHGLDESHFGLAGALRWVCFGVLAGMLAVMVIQISPSDDPDQDLLSFVWNKAIRFGMGLVILGVSYLCAFKMKRIFRRH